MKRLWVALPWGLLGLAACGTSARGIAECRLIERERCSAAVACGYAEEAECQRFQRDQCLHGLTADPVDPLLAEECRASLERAGRCAAELGPDTLVSDCEPEIEESTPDTPTVCEIVVRPELAEACAFLESVPVPAETEDES